MSAVDKILPLERVLDALAPLRAAGRTVGLANGLFDLLHVGHVRYLQGAKAQGDLLVVAVNSDASARALKGPSRPVVPQDERAEIVAALAAVDFVTIFDAPTVAEILRQLRPDVHCKGTDYTPETVPERETARELGIRIAIVGDPKTHASREMIERLRSDSAAL